MDKLLDKIGYAFLPETFSKVLPYCLWYWIIFTLIILWILKKK